MTNESRVHLTRGCTGSGFQALELQAVKLAAAIRFRIFLWSGFLPKARVSGHPGMVELRERKEES